MAQTILITGTSTGIGYGTTKIFVKAGYKVIATVRNTIDADRLKNELGDNIYPVLCDVTIPEQVAKLPDYVKKISENGLLDCLINNAGIEKVDPVEYQSLDDIRAQFEVNFFGLIAVTKTLLPLLGTDIAKKHIGRIFNISSVGGVLALPFLSGYAATKFALEGYSHSLRRELQLFGIKVIIIGPGAIKSEIWQKDKLDSKSYKGTAFETPFEKLKAMMKNAESGAKTEQEMGEFILKIYRKKSPGIRYAFTPNKFFNWTLPSILPHSWVDGMLSTMLAIKSPKK
jgi:short-subunit dehydrogenase